MECVKASERLVDYSTCVHQTCTASLCSAEPAHNEHSNADNQSDNLIPLHIPHTTSLTFIILSSSGAFIHGQIKITKGAHCYPTCSLFLLLFLSPVMSVVLVFTSGAAAAHA